MIKARNKITQLLFLFILLLLTTNSLVSASQREMQTQLDLESAQFLSEQNIHVNKVAYKILARITLDGVEARSAVLPFIYRSSNDKRVFVDGLISDPSNGLDLMRGDEILRYQGMPVESINRLTEFITQTTDVSSVTVRFKRQEREWNQKIPVRYFPYAPRFSVTAKNNQVYLDLSEADFYTIVLSPTLVRMTDSDDELAYVVAHQVAHLTCGHRKSAQLDTGSIVVTQAVGQLIGNALGVNGGLTATVASNYWVDGPYREQDEVAADYVALAYMRAAGYAPKAAVSFLEKEEIEIKPNAKGSIREIHPLSVDRIALVKKRIPEIESLPINSYQITPQPPISLQEDLGPDFSGGADPGVADLTRIGIAECQVYQFGIESDLKPDALIFNNEPKRIAWHASSSDGNPFRGRYFEKFIIEWYSPDGVLYQKRNIEFLSGLQLINSVSLTEEESQKNIGRWKVRLLQGEKLIDERYFLVKDVRVKPLKKRSEILKSGGV